MRENVHVELKLDIFTRIPVESIFDCKLVCKTWLEFLKNDNLFPQVHLRRRLSTLQQLHDDDQNDDVEFSLSQSSTSDFELGFIYLKYLEGNERSCQLWYGKYGKNDDDDEHSFRTVKRINHPNIMVGLLSWKHWNVFIGSCNGLICCSITHYGIEDPIYICNPITREFINLPRFIISDENYLSKNPIIVGGFGYNPSTNEYKVVRIFYPDRLRRENQLGWFQVYTLGDGNGWRDKGEITTYSFCSGRGILVNGELHWLVVYCHEFKILAFNLVLEEFHLIAAPPIVDDGGYDNRQLCVMGRWLCHSHYLKVQGVSHLDMWLLKKKTSSAGYDDMNESGVWIKEFTMTIDYPIDLLGLTKRGEILFIKSLFLCIYDLKTATLEELEKLDDDYCSKAAIPHINSFVSLKALAEKCTRRKKIMSRQVI